MNTDVPVHTGQLDASGLRVAIVASRFNEAVVDRLVDGAIDTLLRHGCLAGDMKVAWVPGAWELPVVTRALASSGTVDAIVALGAVVRGSTPHFDYVAGEAASGCSAVQREHGIPVAFGGGMILLAIYGVEINTAVWIGFIALFGIAEQLRNGGQQLEVGIAALGGHGKRKKQVDAGCVGAVEIDRSLEPDECTGHAGLRDAAMRNRHAVSQTG